MPSPRRIRNAAINCQVIGVLLLLSTIYAVYVLVGPQGTSARARLGQVAWYDLVWAAFSGGAFLRWGSTIQVEDARLRRACRRALLLTCAWFPYIAWQVVRGDPSGLLTLVMFAILLVSLIRATWASAKPAGPEPTVNLPLA